MTFWRTCYHLVWATKLREPLITSAVEKQLFDYIRKKAAEYNCQVFAINGWEDHVHVVLSIPPSASVSEVVHTLKGASSHKFDKIVWQRGYGVFTVGEKQKGIASAYVEKQKQHHAENTANPWLERTDDLQKDGGEIREISPDYETGVESLF